MDTRADDGHLLLSVRVFLGGSGTIQPISKPLSTMALSMLLMVTAGVDAEDARALARAGQTAAGELGDVVGLVQPFQRVLPESAIDEIVPLRNEIVTIGRQPDAMFSSNSCRCGRTARRSPCVLRALFSAGGLRRYGRGTRASRERARQAASREGVHADIRENRWACPSENLISPARNSSVEACLR